MRATLLTATTLGALALGLGPLTPTALDAQEMHEREARHDMMMTSVMPDLVKDVEQVRGKLLGLAEAIPAKTYDWRPGEGVRSVAEVFGHVAADNYFLPTPLGVSAPESTGIEEADYASVQAFEKRELGKEEIIAQLETSFDHLLDAMRGADSMDLGAEVSVFGQQFTARGLWVLTTTHLHEHLGQMIAYARTNGVVPPWSM